MSAPIETTLTEKDHDDAFTEVSFIFGSPVQIRTIVLILGTFLFGILTVLFFYTVRRLRLGAGASRHPPQIELPEDFDDID